MIKRIMFLSLILSFAVMGICFAQEEQQEINKTVIQGNVEEIAEDGSYMVVNGQELLTTQELIEERYLEVGDKIEVTVENTEGGLEALSYEYITEEEATPQEEITPDEGLPEEAVPEESPPVPPEEIPQE